MKAIKNQMIVYYNKQLLLSIYMIQSYIRWIVLNFIIKSFQRDNQTPKCTLCSVQSVFTFPCVACLCSLFKTHRCSVQKHIQLRNTFSWEIHSVEEYVQLRNTFWWRTYSVEEHFLLRNIFWWGTYSVEEYILLRNTFSWGIY